MIWFTSDQHFYHDRIIEYCKRPFKDSIEMNNEIIKRYNSVVKDEDIVYHIGDFTLLDKEDNYRKISRIVSQLKGIKYLILGNHDDFRPFTCVKMGFVSVHTSLEKEGYVMVHDPAASCIDRNKTFLCGHIHELFKIQKNVYNVGVDVQNFYPVSIEQIKKEII